MLLAVSVVLQTIFGLADCGSLPDDNSSSDTDDSASFVHHGDYRVCCTCGFHSPGSGSWASSLSHEDWNHACQSVDGRQSCRVPELENVEESRPNQSRFCFTMAGQFDGLLKAVADPASRCAPFSSAFDGTLKHPIHVEADDLQVTWSASNRVRHLLEFPGT